MKQHKPCDGCRTPSTCTQWKFCPIDVATPDEDVLPDPPGLSELYPDGEALHYDDGKPDLTLIDPGFLKEMAGVLGYGSKKYSVDNWRKGSSYRRYLASTLRHIMAFLEKEDVDPESGEHHLAHAACNLMFVANWQRSGIGLDDRFKR